MDKSIANPNPAQVISRASECMRRLMDAGLSYDDLQIPIDDPGRRQQIVQFWRSGLTENTGTAFTITVNYDRSVEDMVRAGKYDLSNDDITSKHFPSDQHGTSQVCIELVHFDRTMESDEVLHTLDKQGLRPATLKELLALGEQHPDLQRQFPIVALGSAWRDLNGNRYVAYLYEDAGNRRLGLGWLDYGWFGGWPVSTAVRKEPDAPTVNVTVNHDRSVEEMVSAGKYDWSHSDITSRHFPSDTKGTSQVRIELIHFDRVMESDEVLRELDKQGLRPATLKELLALGKQHPDLQRQFPIVALGSAWRDLDGCRYVAYLYEDAGNRRLDLVWLAFRWPGRWRFAAVRK